MNQYWRKSNTLVPAQTTWTKVALDPNVAEKNQEPINRVLYDNELFNNFNSRFAGTWAATTSFGFNSAGGTPDVQFVEGVRDTALNYEGKIETPTRDGYDFVGWFKERDGDNPFNNGDIADQWTYYAHWTDHTYSPVLNANGGHVPDSADVSKTYENIKYSELKKLDGSAFVRDDGKVLVGWNTSSAGTGVSYAADDSVSMHTAKDGGVATLYAMWYEPKATVKLDAQGGSEVADVYYDSLPTNYGALSELQRSGYTFVGWFTEADGGDLISYDTPVVGSTTLYAHWQPNLTVTFDANGGYFDTQDKTTATKDNCAYGYSIGVMPTPQKKPRAFWAGLQPRAIRSAPTKF